MQFHGLHFKNLATAFVFGVVVLLYPHGMQAVVLDEQFLVYNLGSIVGQGDWIASPFTSDDDVQVVQCFNSVDNCIGSTSAVGENHRAQIVTASSSTSALTVSSYHGGSSVSSFLFFRDFSSNKTLFGVEFLADNVIVNTYSDTGSLASSAFVYSSSQTYFTDNLVEFIVEYDGSDKSVVVYVSGESEDERMSPLYWTASPSTLDTLDVLIKSTGTGDKNYFTKFVSGSPDINTQISIELANTQFLLYDPEPTDGDSYYLLRASEDWFFKFAYQTYLDPRYYRLRLREFYPVSEYGGSPTETVIYDDSIYNLSGGSLERFGDLSLYPIRASTTQDIGYELTVQKMSVANSTSTVDVVWNYFGKLFQVRGTDDVTYALPELDPEYSDNWSQTSSSLYSLLLVLKTRIPFSYFYDVSDLVASVTASPDSLDTLTLSTGTSTPIQISVDMFSQDTIERYSSSTLVSTFRTLALLSLYLSVSLLVFFQVKRLF